MGNTIKKIKIINSHTIELEEPAQKGDIIDLNQIEAKNIDTAQLQRLIDAARDEVYNAKLRNLKEQLQNEFDISHQKDIHALKEANNKLIADNKSIEERTVLQQQKLFLAESKNAELELERVRAEKDRAIHDLKEERNIRPVYISDALGKRELQFNETLTVKEGRIRELENLNSALQKEKSSKNTKRMGEELENWCNTEFNSYSLAFPNCKWLKDTQSVRFDDETKGTKADYIFEVYSDDEQNPDSLLTRVSLEMKTEDPTSDPRNRATNASHISKLVKDMEKKKAEYGVLVSELEWNADNDSLVTKVQNVKNVFIVRPPYFVTFLSIINALALKYRSITDQINRDRIELEDVITIREDFEQIKNVILENSVKNLEGNLNNLIKNNTKMRDLIDSNSDLLQKALGSHLQTIRNKIEQFNINKLISRIEDLDNN